MRKLHRVCFHLLLVVVTLTTVLATSAGAVANASSTVDARAAITIDAETGQVLYEKNATKRYPIASVIKILTLAVIEQDIEQGKLKWDQKIKISKEVAKVANDWRFSNVQLNEGESYTVKSLVESMMIVSADGSAEALALASAGSTAAFNKKMQAVAKEAGVTDAKIYNMIGLANGDLGEMRLKNVSKKAENQLSAKDVAKIARYLVEKYPSVLEITKQKFVNFQVSDSQQYEMVNINSMLPQNAAASTHGEVDGLKTGMTDSSGYCFVGTGTFNGRRLITVVLKVPGEYNNQFKVTDAMIGQVLDKYQYLTVNKLSDFKKDVQSVTVAHAEKKGPKTVGLTLKKATTLWLAKNTSLKKADVELILDKNKRTIGGHKLRAPVKKGEKVGVLRVHVKGAPDVDLPVYATKTVHKNKGWF
ncbi:D-alanyl-D-alanine carboxypeptidase family protein [Limosilactobacillus fermentum]|uniref:D-alanyl-D-alanine carboxypeptidase family protein n=1 Tax=Limosilactobacillus fermentum TaxID=1613 RepID=UPI002F26303B